MKKSGQGLNVEKLSASYSDEQRRVSVFESVSIAVSPGEVLTFFGPNGSGKSTLLRTIAGLHKADQGLITFPSHSEHGQSLSLIPQDYRSSFFSWCNLYANIFITLGLPLSQYKKAVKNIDAIKEELSIDLDMHLKPHECSGGMLQQASIIRAFAKRPKIILADEPFSALDINTSNRIKQTFAEKIKSQNIATIIILHNLDDILKVSDQVLAIPGIPFSTKDSKNTHRAKLIKNSNKGNVTARGQQVSFVDVAEDLLLQKSRGV